MGFGKRIVSGDGVITLDEPIDSVCECGQPITFGFYLGYPAVIHASPHCAEFDRMDPMEFIEWLHHQKTAKTLHPRFLQ